MDFRAVDYAASKQSGHQEHLGEYYFFPCIPQLGRELQPKHPEKMQRKSLRIKPKITIS